MLKKMFTKLFTTPLSSAPLCLSAKSRFVVGLCGSLGLVFGMPNFLSAGPGLHGFLPALPILTLLFPAALFILALAADSMREALKHGFLATLPAYSVALYWLGYPLYNHGGVPVLATIPFVAALAAYLSLFPALFCLLIRLMAQTLRARSLWLGLLAGLFWQVQEVLCSVVFTGFPWLNLSMAFVPWTASIQLASIIGAYALAGFLAALSCLAAQSFLPENWLQGASEERLETGVTPFSTKLKRWRALGLAGCGVIIWLGGGWFLLNFDLNDDASDDASDGAIYVALIQGNINQDQKWDEKYRASTIRTYQELSTQAIVALEKKIMPVQSTGQATSEQTAGKLPLLLIWPETSMPFERSEDSADYFALRRFTRRHVVPLLFGHPQFRVLPDGKFSLENQASLLDQKGDWLGDYSKEHLVPFGEYVPLSLDKLPVIKDVFAGILQGVGTFEAGQAGRAEQGLANLSVGGVSLDIGVLVCYESIFPNLARERATHANLLVNISNDAWFGHSAAPLQHLYLSALRAVEQRRWLARCTNSGISAVIDDKGRIVSRSALFESTFVLSRVRLLRGQSHYYRLSSLWARFF